jgi:nucleotide-binding universal stress UspA family protein
VPADLEPIMFALKQVLVPTNRGEPSHAATRYGVAFARQFGARLFLLRVLPQRDLDAVLETERVLEVYDAVDGTADPDPASVARNAARKDLEGLLNADDERDTLAEYILRPSGLGGPGDAIVACANELQVELIVMGKHRLGFVEHLVAGSVAEKVIRHAPCPVLIVQHPEHEFVVADEAPGPK